MSGSAALVSIVAPQAGHVCVAISLPAIVSIVTYRSDCHIDRVRGNRMGLAVNTIRTSDTVTSSVGLGVSSRLRTQLRLGRQSSRFAVCVWRPVRERCKRTQLSHGFSRWDPVFPLPNVRGRVKVRGPKRT